MRDDLFANGVPETVSHEDMERANGPVGDEKKVTILGGIWTGVWDRKGKEWRRRATDDLEPAPSGYPIKLVRDGTPDVINATGEPGELFYGPLPEGEDRGPWLRRKLGEEVVEYLEEREFPELLDVLAVVEALVEYHERTLDYARERVGLHPRGGFREGVMMYGRHPEFDERDT